MSRMMMMMMRRREEEDQEADDEEDDDEEEGRCMRALQDEWPALPHALPLHFTK